MCRFLGNRQSCFRITSRVVGDPEVSLACVLKPISTIVCSECAGAHTHHDEYESLNKDCFGQFSESSESLSVSVHCSNHSPRGILIHPVEDLCLGLLLAPLLRPGSL